MTYSALREHYHASTSQSVTMATELCDSYNIELVIINRFYNHYVNMTALVSLLLW